MRRLWGLAMVAFGSRWMMIGACVVASAWLLGAAAAVAGGGPDAVSGAAALYAPAGFSDPAEDGAAPDSAAQRGAGLPLVQLPDVPPPAPPQAPAGFGAPTAQERLQNAPEAPGAAAESAPTVLPAGADAAPPAKPPSDPVAAALKAALEAFAKAEPPSLARSHIASPAWRKQREGIAQFYALRQDVPVWIADGQWTATARSLIDLVSHAGDDGLDLSAFPVPASPGADAASSANAELALSQAIAAYAFEAAGGRIDPAQVSPLIGDARALPSALEALIEVAIAADPVAVLESYNPPQAGYRDLREKLAELRRERAPIAREPIPAGPALRIGMRDPRVELIRARFGLDVNSAGAGSDELVYDTVVASAVADFQRANGLPASGVLTARTIAALSGGNPSKLEDELIANMERWRWLPRDLGADRIEVNVPDLTLRFFRDGVDIHDARVIVGKPTTPTPIFSNEVKYLTVNPTWYVPQSIVKKELLPKLADDPNYLTRLGYEVTYHGDQIAVRQPPGDRNALGHIVFWFPNQYAVYLHDTSTRGLFATQARALSHGCVRLDQPFKLAEIVLGQGWSEERLRRMIGPTEHWITLPRPVPIHITYFTAYVDAAGKLQLRNDLYGYSKRVKALLGLEG